MSPKAFKVTRKRAKLSAREIRTRSVMNNSWVKTTSLFVFSILLSLVGAEAVIRAFMKDQIVLFPRYHTAAHYGNFVLRRLRPNTVFWHTSVDGSWQFVTNAQGFRDQRDFNYVKLEGRLRVLALGDSHTEGFEVRQSQTFSAIIERYLNVRGVDAEVLNTGISGFSTAEEFVFLTNEGIRYDPDVVVLGFYANDFEDNVKAGLYKLVSGQLVVAKREHVPGVRVLDIINSVAPLRWLSEGSYFYSFGMNTVWKRAKVSLFREAEQQLTTEFAVPTEEVTDYKKKLMAALLKEMYRYCRARDIKLVIIDIPMVSSDKQFRSSVPEDMVEVVRTSSDAFISSENVLSKFRNLTDIHVPHGHRHISEFTHTLLGTAAGSAIVGLNRVSRRQASVAHP